jgi:hypothetical protein
VTVGVALVVGVVAGVLVDVELLVGVDEVLDNVELVDCVVDGVEEVLGVVPAEVVGGVEVGAELVGVVVKAGLDDNVAGDVEAADDGPLS